MTHIEKSLSNVRESLCESRKTKFLHYKIRKTRNPCLSVKMVRRIPLGIVAGLEDGKKVKWRLSFNTKNSNTQSIYFANHDLLIHFAMTYPNI